MSSPSHSGLSDAEDDLQQLAIHDDDEEEQQEEEEEEEQQPHTQQARSGEPQGDQGDSHSESSAEGIVADMGLLSVYISELVSDKREVVERSVRSLRRLLSVEQNPPLQAVIDGGGVAPLVALLRDDSNHTVQFEAAWCLTNICSGDREQTQTVIDAGALPLFIQLVSSPDFNVREQAVWAIGNVAGDSVELRDLCLDLGALAPLLAHVPGSSVAMLRNVSQALSNLVRFKPQPAWHKVEAALPACTQLLSVADAETQAEACWALGFLADNHTPQNEHLDALVASGCLPPLIELVGHQEQRLRVPALRAVGNVISGDDRHTRAAIDAGALPVLRERLSDRAAVCRKEAAWTLSNCTDHLQAMIDADVWPELVRVATEDRPEVAAQAAWALSNACSAALHRSECMAYLLAVGVAEALLQLVRPAQGHETRNVSLEGLQLLLEHAQADEDCWQHEAVRRLLRAGARHQLRLLLDGGTRYDDIQRMGEHVLQLLTEAAEDNPGLEEQGGFDPKAPDADRDPKADPKEDPKA